MLSKKFKNKLIRLLIAKNIISWLIFVLFFDFILFPMPILANEINVPENSTLIEEIIESFVITPKPIFSGQLPENKNIEIANTGFHVITAYNSEVSQCDASPCITANGFNVCKHNIEDTIAANFLKFGTKVRIPELFGDRIFIVRDRMNQRHSDRVDVWMKYKENALTFGKRYAKIEVLE